MGDKREQCTESLSRQAYSAWNKIRYHQRKPMCSRDSLPPSPTVHLHLLGEVAQCPQSLPCCADVDPDPSVIPRNPDSGLRAGAGHPSNMMTSW